MPDSGETVLFTHDARFSTENCRMLDLGEPLHATSDNLLSVNNLGTNVPPACNNDKANAENAFSAPSFEFASDTNNACVQYCSENPWRCNRNKKFPAHLHDFV